METVKIQVEGFTHTSFGISGGWKNALICHLLQLPLIPLLKSLFGGCVDDYLKNKHYIQQSVLLNNTLRGEHLFPPSSCSLHGESDQKDRTYKL